MEGPQWVVEIFRDRRGRHPVVEFLEDRPPRDRKATLGTLRIVLELTRFQPAHTIGRPHVETLDAPIKELRTTPLIRILFSWEAETRIMLLLEATLKKGGGVDPHVIERARQNLSEWRVTRSSDPLEGL